MEANLAPDGRVLFMVSGDGFFLLHTFVGEALSRLQWKKGEFPTRVGIAFEEASSLDDEFFLNREELLDYPRRGPEKVRTTGTVWDRLPKMEAEVLPDGRLALTLARGELGIFANCVEASIEEMVPTGAVVERADFESIKGIEVEEAEELRDELLRLDRETRVERSG
jgi:hypothetical protein